MTRITKAHIALAVNLCLSATLVAAPPDLTSGGVPGDSETINLGPTGLRGWVYHVNANTSESRQIQVKMVAAGSPADGLLAVDDVILGADGTGAVPVNFSSNARNALAAAINHAEARNPATLKLIRWRAGATSTVELTLQTMGAYSATAPYNCPKSALILENGLQFIMNSETPGRYSFGTLSLLAGNNPANPNNAARITRARNEARALIPSAAEMAQMMSDVRDTASTWQRGHTLIVLSEYYLVTGDVQVLPAIEAYAVNIAKNQSLFGTVGHIYAEKNPDGSNNGPMGGVYGTVNSTGMPCFLGLLLARECGLANPEIAPAIERTSRFFASYTGLGAVPYGEHEAFWQGHENNGKSGLAAVSFALEENRAGEQEFFAKMATASASEREIGHTGAFFNYLWAPLGAAAGSEEAAASLFSRLRSHFDLARRWDGGFEYDCLNEGPNSGSQYNDFRMSTAILLTYALPLRQLHLTGRGHDPARWLSTTDVDQAEAVDGYVATSRTTAELVSDLGSWSPKVQRLAGNEFAIRTTNAATIAQITNLATDPASTSRVGACLALGRIVDTASAAARAATLAGLLTDPVNHVRYMAAEGMRYLPQSAKLGELNTILSAAASTGSPLLPYNEEDPLHFAHSRLAMLLFYGGNAYGPKGVIWNTVTGVDRNYLYPAIRAVAANPIGQARSTLNQVYKILTTADVEALADTIVDSIHYRAPADKMFSGGIRLGGLQALQAKGKAEGVPLCLAYDENDPVDGVTTDVLGVLQLYAARSTTVVPDSGVIDYLNDLLGGSHAAEAQAVLNAIAANPNPTPLTPFKSIQSVTADSPALTLPSTNTMLHVASTDHAKGDSVYTWRKVHGAGTVSFTPNGTGASVNTGLLFDGTAGKYLFEVTMSDSRGFTQVSATVPVTLYNSGGTLPPNDPPTANNQLVTLNQEIPTPITLGANDPEGYALIFTVTSPPAHGTLSGTAPNLIYTADDFYVGTDSVTFEVMDSEGQVASATVSLTITPAPNLYWDGIDLTGNPDGGGGTWDNGVTSNWDDAITAGGAASWNNANNDKAIFGGAAGTVTIDTGGVTVGGLNFITAGYIINGAPLTFGAAGEIIVNTGTTTIGAVVGGSSTITKTGGGILNLTATNTFTGGTVISGGTLTIGGNNTAATLGPANYAGNIANNGTLLLTNSTSQTLSGIISGTGTLQKAGGGTLTLSGANTYTGKTIIAATGGGGPTVSVASLNSVNGGTPLLTSSSLGAPITLTNGTIQLGSSGNIRSCALTYTGSGEITDRVMHVQFNSGNTHTIRASNATGLLKFTSPFIITPSSGGTSSKLALRGTGNGEIAAGFATIPGILEKSDAGTWTVGGSSASNAVTVVAGTLVVKGALVPKTTLTASGGTLTINGSLSVAASTISGATVNGSGGLTFDIDGTTSNLITMTSGTLTATGLTIAINPVGSGLTETGYVLVNATGGMITGNFAGLTGAPGYELDYDTPNQVKLIKSGAYDTWKVANAPGSNPDDDTDGDGVDNAVEFVLGGLATTNDLAKLPAVSTSGGDMLVSFLRTQASIDPNTSVTLEVGTDLTTWPASYLVPDAATANNPGVSVVKNIPANGTDTVTLTLPQNTDAGKFVRLKVVITP